MIAGIATIDTVVAVRINQLAKILIGLYQCIDVVGSIAEVDIVVGCSVTEHQGTMELRCTGNGTVVVTRRILMRGAHEAFGIDGVVVAPRGGWCYGDATAEYFPTLRHGHQGIETAIAPAPDGDAAPTKGQFPPGRVPQADQV